MVFSRSTACVLEHAVVAEGSSSVNNTMTTLETGVERHAVGVILHQPKSAADIIISNVDLQVGVRYAEIVQPDHEPHLRTGKR